MIVPVDDLEDPRLEPYRDVRDRDLRGRDDLFLVESKRVVARFVKHHEQVHSLLLSEAAVDNMEDVLRDIPDSIPVYVTSLEGMIQIAGFRIHRGVLAAGHPGGAESSRTFSQWRRAGGAHPLLVSTRASLYW